MIYLLEQDLGKLFIVPIEGKSRSLRFVGIGENGGIKTYSFEANDGSGFFYKTSKLDGIILHI